MAGAWAWRDRASTVTQTKANTDKTALDLMLIVEEKGVPRWRNEAGVHPGGGEKVHADAVLHRVRSMHSLDEVRWWHAPCWRELIWVSSLAWIA